VIGGRANETNHARFTCFGETSVTWSRISSADRNFGTSLSDRLSTNYSRTTQRDHQATRDRRRFNFGAYGKRSKTSTEQDKHGARQGRSKTRTEQDKDGARQGLHWLIFYSKKKINLLSIIRQIFHWIRLYHLFIRFALQNQVH